MSKQLSVILFIFLLLAVVYAIPSAAQDKQENAPAQKMEMTKSPKEAGALQSLTCPSPCNFCVKSRDEKELLSVAKTHMKKAHKMTMSDAKLKEMIKTEEQQ